MRAKDCREFTLFCKYCVCVMLIIDAGLELLFALSAFHISGKSVYCCVLNTIYMYLGRTVYNVIIIVSFRTDLRSSYIMNSTIAGIEVSETSLKQVHPGRSNS